MKQRGSKQSTAVKQFEKENKITTVQKKKSSQALWSVPDKSYKGAFTK